MSLQKITGLIGMCCILMSGVATAGVIDFEDNAQASGSQTIGGDVTSGGFLFDSSTDHTHLVNNNFGADSGSTWLGSDDFAGISTLTMSKIGGGGFNLLDLDVAGWNPGSASTSLKLIGNLVGGGTTSITLALGAFANAAVNFINVDSVIFDSIAGAGDQYYAIDNINVSDVPAPGVLVLLLSGLIGLGYRRKIA